MVGAVWWARCGGRRARRVRGQPDGASPAGAAAASSRRGSRLQRLAALGAAVLAGGEAGADAVAAEGVVARREDRVLV
jgi:hypothetical protein